MLDSLTGNLIFLIRLVDKYPIISETCLKVFSQISEVDKVPKKCIQVKVKSKRPRSYSSKSLVKFIT